MIYIINKNELENLYLKKRMSINRIAKKFNVSYETIRYKLIRFGVPRRTKSEAMIKFPKKPFSQNLTEKAYMLGLRSGDIYAVKHYNHIRVTSTTTHVAFLEMMKDVFGKYSNVGIHRRFNKDHNEWIVYADMDKSFNFIIKKPKKIPKQIIDNNKYFYHFLGGYVDCEGTFIITKSNENDVRLMFRIGSYDKLILQQIKNKLKAINITPHLYLDRLSGSKTTFGRTKKDFYVLKIYRTYDLVSIIKILLNYCKHEEKIQKMKLILRNYKKSWSEIKETVSEFKNNIERIE